MGDFFELEPLPAVVDDDRYEGLEDETFGGGSDEILGGAGAGGDGFFSFAKDADAIEREKAEFLRRMQAGEGGGQPSSRAADDADTFGGDADTFGGDADTFGGDADTFGDDAANDDTFGSGASAGGAFGAWDSPSHSQRTSAPAPSTPTSSKESIWASPGGASSSIWSSGSSSSFLPLSLTSELSSSPGSATAPPPADVSGRGQPPRQEMPAPAARAAAYPPTHPHAQAHPSGGHQPYPHNSAGNLPFPPSAGHHAPLSGGMPLPGGGESLSLEELEASLAAGRRPPQQQPPPGQYPPQMQHMRAPPPGSAHPGQPMPGQPMPGQPVLGQPLQNTAMHAGQRAPQNFQQIQVEQQRQQQVLYEKQQREAMFSKLIQQRTIQVKRNGWKQNMERMTAKEIDSIIRIQENQLKNIKSSSYVGDYYFQTYFLRQFAEAKAAGKNPLENLPPKLAPPVSFHLPICDTAGAIHARPKKPNGDDPLAGALGRIPAHSVKAPRALLQIKSDSEEGGKDGEEQDKSEQQQSLMRVCYPLVLIEDCYTCLLDLEDLDLILANTPIQVLGERSYYNVLKKREAIIEVFCNICGITLGRQPLPHGDDSMVLILRKAKGKKLFTRAMKSFPWKVNFSIVAFAARCLGRIVSRESSTQQGALFLALVSCMDQCTLAHLSGLLELFVHAHTGDEMEAVFGTAEGVMFLAKLLQCAKKARKAEDPRIAPHEMKEAWKHVFAAFLDKSKDRFSSHTRVAPDVDQTHADRVWGLLGTVVGHSDPAQSETLVTCLRESITQALAHNPTGAVRCLLQSS